MFVLYGTFRLLIAGLEGLTQRTFDTFAALYVIFNVIGFLATASSYIFVPFAMQLTPTDETSGTSPSSHQTTDSSIVPSRCGQNDKEQSGLSMSVRGWNGLNAGQAVIFITVIGLSYLNSIYVGLYTTTAAGALSVVLALAAWPTLPSPVRQGADHPRTITGRLIIPFSAFLTLFQGLRVHHEAFKYLVAFTIYNDTLFAFTTVFGNSSISAFARVCGSTQHTPSSALWFQCFQHQSLRMGIGHSTNTSKQPFVTGP